MKAAIGQPGTLSTDNPSWSLREASVGSVPRRPNAWYGLKSLVLETRSWPYLLYLVGKQVE